MAREQGNAFNTPRTEPAQVEPRQLWQQQDDVRQQNQEKWLDKTKITPVADTIGLDQYTRRNTDINNIGKSATAGAVASYAYQRQQNEINALRGFQDQQTQAMMQAYNQYMGMAGSMRPKVSPTGALSAGGSYSGGDVSWDGSDAALADMMRKAGFPEDQIGIGMAIAKGESGWNPRATHNNSNGSIDQGIFQINSIHKARYAGQDIFDPQTNINVAYQVWKDAGGSWRPWVVYQTGKYKQYVGAVPQTRLNAQPSVTGGMVTTGNGTLRNQIIQAAMPVLNLPYVWGGNSMKYGVDCSGLVQQVYKQVLGWDVPRQARSQAVNGAVGQRVGSYNQLKPGDLVAFQWAGGYAGPNTVSHIAIYMGGGKIIEAYGGNNGRIRALGNSAQDRGAIYISVKMPGE
jgi:cell wall-associated NlpC family hydrolase